MIPAYIGCIVARVWCALDLLLNPLCALKVVRCYCILSVYTWCRVFIAVFTRLAILESNLYTVSITLAGLCCFPAIGSGVNVLACLLICGYGLGLSCFASPGTRAAQCMENSRDMFDDKRFQSVLNAPSASTCPFAPADGGGEPGAEDRGTAQLKALFNSLDADGSGVIEYGELERIAASAHSRQVMQIIEMHKKKHDDGAVVTKLDFAAFRKFFASRASLDVKDGRGDSALHRAVAKGSSYQQQARVIFNSIDRQGDGYIDAEELGYLLLGYSLPFGPRR